jgi:hypothetical protein
MKRSRSHENSAPIGYTHYGDFLTVPKGPEQPHSGLITPPPEKEDRPSKILRRGSKLLSALRSLTNSGMYFIPPIALEAMVLKEAPI